MNHVFCKKSEYNDIREKSFLQWLDEMEKHDDVAVRCGVKLAREYMQYLKDENEKLREENELKNSYLKKMKMRVRSLAGDNVFFMMGITDGRKDFDFHQQIICDICGKYGRFQVFMTYTVLSLFLSHVLSGISIIMCRQAAVIQSMSWMRRLENELQQVMIWRFCRNI